MIDTIGPIDLLWDVTALRWPTRRSEKKLGILGVDMSAEELRDFLIIYGDAD